MKIVVNDQAMQSHNRDNEPPDLAPWREADDLLKQGKPQDAANVIMAKVDPKAPPRHSTLVFRVMIQIHHLLKGNGWDDEDTEAPAVEEPPVNTPNVDQPE